MKDTLFYDGQCPLCLREMQLLQSRTKNRLILIDIHHIKAEADPDIPNKEQLLRRLHLKKSDGKWLIGLDANVHGWSYTPLGRILQVIRLPGIRQLADKVYGMWADKRDEKRYSCGKCMGGEDD
jgi:predicted DCC family thiol-disulfide oxidoreductase YuxK